MARLSIVVPVLNEERDLRSTLAPLQALRAQGVEVIVADGGSTDATRTVAGALADRVLEAPRGRASQMNAGARASRGEVLLFLHADTVLPEGAVDALMKGLAAGDRAWGRFDVRIPGGGALLALVAGMMNARSRWTGIATGDQAMFALRSAFEAAGGFPDIPLMEDLALSRSLGRISPPLCLRDRVVTSARRWQRHGTWRTIVLMWRLRLAYALGADPQELARRYGVERTSS